MSKIYYRAIIEDVQNEKCTESEILSLLDVFEYTVKTIATTLAKKAWFDLKDFSTAKERGIDRFTLSLHKQTINKQEQWTGVFEYGQKKSVYLVFLRRFKLAHHLLQPSPQDQVGVPLI